jgi:polyvinyl alcohol dehydrogenase (cytochrome)
MRFRRGFALGYSSLGLVAFAAIGCSSSDDAKSEPPKEPPTWVSQAYDVQSTWHDTNEPKLNKDSVGGLVPLWAVSLGLNSTVTVVDGIVYTASASGIAAIDGDSGKVKWRQAGTPEASIGTSSSPTYDPTDDGGVLYIDNGANGMIYALAAKTGDILWKTQVDPNPRTAGYSSPIVSGDRIYVGVSSNEEFGTTENATFKGSVVALEKATGKIAWQSPTAGDGENGCAVWSTVALDPTGGAVYAATGNNYTGDPGPGSDSIFAFDMESGKKRWQFQANTGDVFTINNPRSPDSDFGANPVVFDYDGGQYVAAGQKSGGLYVLDRTSGEKLAERQFGNGSSYIGGIFQALAWDGRYLYTVNNQTKSEGENSEAVVTEDSGTPSVLFALEPKTLDVVWERQLPAWVWAPITLVNGMALVGAERTLEAVDLKDGKTLFSTRTDGTVIGAPVVNNGRVYVASGLTYYFGHPDDKLYAFALPDDPAVGKHFEPDPPPDLSAPTFSNVYKAIISKTCADAQCHGSSTQGNLNFTSQLLAASALISIPAKGTCPGTDGGTDSACSCGGSGKLRVSPGHPEESLLVEKLSGTVSCGDRMPPTGEPISDELQTLVKNWIKAGATAN